jgi:ribose transport system permease protein
LPLLPEYQFKGRVKHMHKLRKFVKNNFILLVILALIAMFTAISGKRFFNFDNFITIARQAAILGMTATGLMILMLTGNIDLSLGGVMSFTSVFFAQLISVDYFNINPFLAMLIVILIGIAFGWLKGLLITSTKMNALIATLGISTALKGFTFLLCDSKTIGGLNPSLVFLGQGYIGPFPMPVVFCGILMVVVAFVCKKTYLGRYMAATGSNSEAARLGGINTDRITRIAFILATVCSVIATIVLTYRVKSGQPNCGDAYQMNNLLACTVGGISFGFGGEGGVLNVIYGILVVGIITNGMTVMGLSSYWQYVMQGTILAFAVGMDYVQRRRSKA